MTEGTPFSLGGMNQMFAQKKKEPQQDFGEIQSVARDLSRRVKVVEGRIEQQRKTMQVNEQNMIRNDKKIELEVKNFITELNEIKADIRDIKDQMSMVMNEVKVSAKQEDVKALERYINLWEPIKFCTENDVKAIVKRILEDRQDIEKIITKEKS